MRVWIVNHYTYLPSTSAGTRHFDLGVALRGLGYDVRLIGCSYFHKEHRPFREEELVGATREVDITWFGGMPYRGNGPRRFLNMADFSFRAVLSRRLRRSAPPDVVIGSTPHPFAALAAERLARRYDVPFVLDVRDIWPDALVELGGWSTRHPVAATFRAVTGYLLRHAQAVTTVLPRSEELLIERGARDGQVTWLPNARLFPDAPATRPASENGSFLVGYAGTLSDYIDKDVLVTTAELAATSGERIRLRVLGTGAARHRLVDEVTRRGLTRWLHVAEPVSRRDVLGEMAACDALILPYVPSDTYRWGVGPNKLFDYMAVARPIVAPEGVEFSPVGAVAPRIVRYQPDRSDGLFDTLRALSTYSEDERRSLGRSLCQYGRSHHDLRATSRVLAGVLDEVTKR